MYGFFFVGVLFLWMMLLGLFFGVNVKVSFFWLIMSWVIVIVGEMLILLVGLLVISKFVFKVF